MSTIFEFGAGEKTFANRLQPGIHEVTIKELKEIEKSYGSEKVKAILFSFENEAGIAELSVDMRPKKKPANADEAKKLMSEHMIWLASKINELASAATHTQNCLTGKSIGVDSINTMIKGKQVRVKFGGEKSKNKDGVVNTYISMPRFSWVESVNIPAAQTNLRFTDRDIYDKTGGQTQQAAIPVFKAEIDETAPF